MARIKDFVVTAAPVAQDVSGSAVFDRFQNEPNTLAIAVVDADLRPVGLVERNAFTLKMAAEFGRALYARRPISALMDSAPLVLEGETEAEDLFRTVDAAGLTKWPPSPATWPRLKPRPAPPAAPSPSSLRS